MMSVNIENVGNISDNKCPGNRKLLSAFPRTWFTKWRVLVVSVIFIILMIFLFTSSKTRHLMPMTFDHNYFNLKYDNCARNPNNEENPTLIKVAGDKAEVACSKPSLLLKVVNRTDVLAPCESRTITNWATNLSERSSSQRLPHSVVIGVMKGGTGALKYFLNLHPAIQFAPREVHFFDEDDRYAQGLEWYRRQMRPSRSDQITMEKTPAYFVTPEAPHRIFQMNSSIRLIVTVRDPVDRTVSDYVHTTKHLRGKAIKSFEEMAIDANTGEVNTKYGAIYRSFYDDHLNQWLRYFPLQQFLFLSAENLVADPIAELRKVENFLGLQHHLTSTRFHYNKRRGFYCMCVNDENEGREKSGEVIALKENCLPPSKGRTHPTIDPNVLQKLRDFFRPHNERFYNLVGRNFCWN